MAKKMLDKKERLKQKKAKALREADEALSQSEKESKPRKGLGKYGKSIEKMGNKKTSTEKLMSSVTCVGYTVTQIRGEIVSRDEHGVTLRYKKEKSRSIVRDTFPNENIVAIAQLGEKAVVYVRSIRAVVSEKGSVKQLSNGWLQCTTTFGETLEVNPRNNVGFEVQIRSVEDEEYLGGGKQKVGKRIVEESDDDDTDPDD